MIIREFFKKIYLFLYIKVSGVDKEIKEILDKYDKKHQNEIAPLKLSQIDKLSSDIDDLDKLSTGTIIGDDGQIYSYAKPMPERFWKFFKFKSKNYDDDIFRKKNLLFMGMIPKEDVKKVKEEIAKSEAYRHRKEKNPLAKEGKL